MRFSYQVPVAELKVSFARSGGKGGQNVNKVNTKAEVRWDLKHSRSLPEDLRQFLLNSPLLKPYLTTRGEIVITSERSRSQLQNRVDAEDKLRALVARALKPVKKRIATRQPRSVNATRLRSKKMRGERKNLRRPPVSD